MDSRNRVVVDKSMLGFTPLSPCEDDDKQMIDCILIHGWGGHAIGSFKDPNSSYMWARDSLTRHIPQLRVWTYGYESRLQEERSIGDVYEWAESLRRELRSLRKKSQVNRPATPMIFIVHSLGGWVFKEAVIRMKPSSHDIDQQNLRSIYGALFFGVPNQGMDTTDIASMINHLPARYTLALLEQTLSFRLRQRAHQDFCQAFGYRDSKIISFIELKLSPTVQKDKSAGDWKRVGPPKLLVGPSSASYGRSWEGGDDYIVSVNVDHYNMISLPEDDREVYPKAVDVLHDFVARAISVIEARLENPGRTSDQTSSIMPRGRSQFPSNLNIPIPPTRFNERAFYGRVEILSRMHSHLTDLHVQTSAFALYGQGGVGKTQLALKYALDHCDQFDYILWFYAATSEKLSADFAIVAQEVGACHDTDLDQSRRQLHKWLQKNDRWLLVFDNADDLDILEPYLPSTFGGRGQVILTSRNIGAADCTSDGEEVTSFSVIEAAGLLLSQLPGEYITWETAKGIARRAGGLPLALSFMVRYINYFKPSVQEFLALYDKHRELLVKISARDGPERGYDKTIATAWTVPIMSLEPESSEILNILALLDPDGIPVDIIQHFDLPESSSVCEALTNLEKHTLALVPLQRTYLIQKMSAGRDRGNFYIHRLVQDAARRRWNTLDWQTTFDRVVFCLAKVYPRQEKGQSMLKSYPKCSMYSAHVLSVLDHYIDHQENINLSMDFAEVLAHCGWYYYERAQLSTAEKVLKTAKSICDRVTMGQMNLTLALIYNNLAGVYVSRTQVALCAAHMGDLHQTP